jgi:predicted metal-dependent phosphoesterase TrpH
MKFELHCHSLHSHGSKITWEGLASPSQIARVLKRKGITGFAITDHDSIKGWKEAEIRARKESMIFIPGLEISTSAGHLIALGINERIKPGLPVKETLDAVHGQGGLAVAPHPLDIRGEGLGREFAKCDAAEIFNSLNLTRIENYLAARQVRKLGMPAVGGSDAHCLEMLGMTVNHIDADDLDSALLEIKRGNVKIEGRYVPVPVVVSWTRRRMRLSYGDIRKYISKNYSKPKAAMALFLLDRFVNSESGGWNVLGSFAVSVSTVYSILRLAFV